MPGFTPRSALLTRAAAALALAFALSACETIAPVAGGDDPVQASAAAPRPGADPKDDVDQGKLHYREQNYGLAEKHFRAASERTPQNAEAWLGLAASYDQLQRFDLADRAYREVFRLAGTTTETLNNRGLSYMLRGDLLKARRDLKAARDLDPENEQVINNLRSVERRMAGAR